MDKPKDWSSIIAGVFILLGSVLGVLTRNYNKAHVDHPLKYGVWIAASLPIIGLFFLMPWKKKNG